MHSIRFAVSILLVGAVQAAAQGKDTASSNANQTSGAASVGPITAPGPDDDMTPRCWLGCRGSLNLQRTAASEWRNGSQGRMDTLMALIRGKRKAIAIVPADAKQAGLETARSGSDAIRAGSTGQPAEAATAATSQASEADGERFLVEEWRRSEIGIADSIHHDVLMRISRLYDSAQAPKLSVDARLGILQRVDGVNSVNQLMWLQRRADVNREADSAVRAIPPPPRAP
jgi:hypothetical protein